MKGILSEIGRLNHIAIAVPNIQKASSCGQHTNTHHDARRLPPSQHLSRDSTLATAVAAASGTVGVCNLKGALEQLDG